MINTKNIRTTTNKINVDFISCEDFELLEQNKTKKIYCITTNRCVVHINASSKKMALIYQQLNMPKILNEFGKKITIKDIYQLFTVI